MLIDTVFNIKAKDSNLIIAEDIEVTISVGIDDDTLCIDDIFLCDMSSMSLDDPLYKQFEEQAEEYIDDKHDELMYDYHAEQADDYGDWKYEQHKDRMIDDGK